MRPFGLSLIWLVRPSFPLGGDEEDRTPDPLLAKQVLSQLSYTPIAGTRLSSYAFLCEVTVFGIFKIEQLLNTHFPLI